MKRIIDPLSLMGAKIISNDNKAPLTFKPSNLNGINYEMNISSAQVKLHYACMIEILTVRQLSNNLLYQEITLKGCSKEDCKYQNQ